MKISKWFLLPTIILFLGQISNAKEITIREINDQGQIVLSQNQTVEIKNIQLFWEDPTARFLIIREISKHKQEPLHTTYWSSKYKLIDFLIPETEILFSEQLLLIGVAHPLHKATIKQKKYYLKSKELKNGIWAESPKPKNKITKPFPDFHTTRIEQVLSGNRFKTSEGVEVKLIGTQLPSLETRSHQCFRERSLAHLQRYQNQKVTLIEPTSIRLNSGPPYLRWVHFANTDYSLNQEVIRTSYAKIKPTQNYSWDQKLINYLPIKPEGAFVSCIPKIMGIK